MKFKKNEHKKDTLGDRGSKIRTFYRTQIQDPRSKLFKDPSFFKDLGFSSKIQAFSQKIQRSKLLHKRKRKRSKGF
jgi:predicted nucleotidyltransferase